MGIARKKPLTRSSKPIARKSAKKRTYKTARCDKRTCKKPQDVKWGDHGLCKSHAKVEAHIRIREFVRERDNEQCVIPHPAYPCYGAWQPNHGFDRDEMSTTWEEWNVMGGCAALNTWAHHHKLRWYAMLRNLWGVELYEQRHEQMLHGDPMDVAEVLARYAKWAK